MCGISIRDGSTTGKEEAIMRKLCETGSSQYPHWDSLPAVPSGGSVLGSDVLSGNVHSG